MAASALRTRRDNPESVALREAGRTAAAEILAGGVEVGDSIDDIREQTFADGFLSGLTEGMANPPGWMRNILDGTRAVAASLNTEPQHGFVELIQNADDVGATVVRFAISADGRQILAVHDGSPVRPVNVLAMTLALVSTKVEDTDATGKFGIGLKTVLRFASSYEVHCAPYSFRVLNQTARQVKTRPGVRNLYAPEKMETLVTLALLDDYDPDGLRDWFKSFSADGLMFMRSVRGIELRGPSGRLLDAKALKPGVPTTLRIRMAGKRAEVEHIEMKDTSTGATWWRLSTKLPVPPTTHRSGKKTPGQVPFALAYTDSAPTGRLFAGLPLAVGGSLPFHLNAMFDPNASRTDLLEGAWNGWTLDRLTQFAAAAAVHRLAHDTRHAWSAVPLASEVTGLANDWLAGRLSKLVETVHDAVREDGRIQTIHGTKPLAGCRPEVGELDPLISDNEVERLTGDPTVPREARDQPGRWRRVLKELEVTNWLDVEEILQMCDWADLERPGTWFVSLLNVMLGDTVRAEKEARKRRCLLLTNGERISPEDALRHGLLLGISTAGSKTLGEYLGLLRPVDAAFLSDEPAAIRVREWLTTKVGLRTEGGDDDALEALARRDAENPMVLDKHGVLLLRDALRRLPDKGAELGEAIGSRVLVDGFTYDRGRRKEIPVRPADAYLPPAIDTGKYSWPAAAGKTPGLNWIHSSYKNLLASASGRGHGKRDDPETVRLRRAAAAREKSGAQSFFSALGAETAPRLIPRPLDKSLFNEWAATVSHHQLRPSQRAHLSGSLIVNLAIQNHQLALQNDHFSPDLKAALEDISRAKVPEGRERAQALLRSLTRAWGRKYARFEQATAVRAYGTMVPLAPVPATWAADAAEIKWMTNELGRRRKPSELAIRTAAFELVFSDAPDYYAYGLGPDDVESGPVRAFGFARQLRASGVLDRLVELRDEELAGRPSDPYAVSRCYRALSDSVPTGAQRGRLDDVTVSDVKKLFKTGAPGATGLVRTTQGWRRPADVLLGRPIFQTRASFVSVEAPALWQVLDVHRPTTDDCLQVLRDIAADGIPSQRDEAILIDSYRYLSQLLRDSDSPAPRSLLRAPLWTMQGWVPDRSQPVYAIEDQALQLALGEKVRVWQPKVRLAELEGLLTPFGVTKLDEDSFGVLGINSGALAAGSDVQKTIRAAAAHLREWLALNDAELHEKLAKIPQLEESRAAVTHKLYVQITLPDGREEEVRRQAHVDRRSGQLMFVLADSDYVDDSDLMGRLLGNLVNADQREEFVLAHGWQTALNRVDRDVQLQGLELAADIPEEKTARPKRGKSKVSGTSEHGGGHLPTDGEGPPDKPAPPPRRLKKLDDLDAEPEWAEGGRPPKPIRSPKHDKPLRKPDPTRPGPAGESAGLMPWTPYERETLGLRFLERKLGTRLKDIRNQHGVGADALDQENGIYYELKVHAGHMPDSVRLEPDEFKLARNEMSRITRVPQL
jgi:hypothetical protein